MADDNEFQPRLGRMRGGGGRKARSYVGRVLAATNLARAGAKASVSRKAFTGCRIGRGAGIGTLLAARGERSAFGTRRVIVKVSLVKLAGKGTAGAAAHLRYLQRDGATRDGASGRLYGADADDVDGKAFRERGQGDRHQFRFIVSAEDGADYDDLKPLTRRLMTRVAEDLGTTLDWVAVDHADTGHPHTHIVVRGKDHRGADLIIARDYLTSGIRERACELVDLDLGPRSTREIETGLRAEVEQERLTSLDRSLIRDAGDDGIVGGVGGTAFDQALCAGRLAKLRQLGLAQPVGGLRWRLNGRLEEVLRTMGERGDIVRTMQRALAARGLARVGADQQIYDPAGATARPLVGRVIQRGLADEHADRHYLIVDGVDGRTHFVDVGKGADLDLIPEGATVRIAPRRVEVRAVDRTIAAVAAANHGRYDVDAHLRHDPSATQTFAETHVRRLEAMRRQGGSPTREPWGEWIVGDDHLARAAAHDARLVRDRPVAVDLLAAEAPKRLATLEAATWIDRDLVAEEPMAVRAAGFGADVRDAQARRRQWLVAQGFAEERDGAIRYRSGLLATLQRRELLRIAGQLRQELGKAFDEAAPGGRIDGVLRRRIDLVSGRFALVENSREFTLVPWRPVLARQLGRSVAGVLRGDGVSWTIGRGRAGPSIE